MRSIGYTVRGHFCQALKGAVVVTLCQNEAEVKGSALLMTRLYDMELPHTKDHTSNP